MSGRTPRQVADLVEELEVATEAYEIADTDPTGEAEAAEAAQRGSPLPRARVRRSSTVSGRLPSPDELVTALDTAGFVRAGEGRHYYRYRWPADRTSGSLVVLKDGDAPEYAAMVAGLLGELDDAERNGQAATATLDLIGPTQPDAARTDSP